MSAELSEPAGFFCYSGSCLPDSACGHNNRLGNFVPMTCRKCKNMTIRLLRRNNGNHCAVSTQELSGFDTIRFHGIANLPVYASRFNIRARYSSKDSPSCIGMDWIPDTTWWKNRVYLLNAVSNCASSLDSQYPPSSLASNSEK